MSVLAAAHEGGLSVEVSRRAVERERRVEEGGTGPGPVGARMVKGTRGGRGVKHRAARDRRGGGGGGCHNALKTEGATAWTPLRAEVVRVGRDRQPSLQ